MDTSGSIPFADSWHQQQVVVLVFIDSALFREDKTLINSRHHHHHDRHEVDWFPAYQHRLAYMYM